MAHGNSHQTTLSKSSTSAGAAGLIRGTVT